LLFTDFQDLAAIYSRISKEELLLPENMGVLTLLRSTMIDIINGVQESPGDFPSDWSSGIRNWDVVL